MSKAGGGVKSLTVRVYGHPTVTHAEKKSPFANYSNQQMTEAPAVGLFFCLVLGGIAEIVLHPPLHRAGKKKPHYQNDSRVSFIYLVGREGLEPATKGL